MRSAIPGKNTVPCQGGCGSKAVNHIRGSEIAKLCSKASPGRSNALKIRNVVRNQNIKARTRANDSIAFHNSMTELTEKILNVILKKSKVHSLKIRGYDKQTEEYLEGNSDPMFNEARASLDSAIKDAEESPSEKSRKALEDAYSAFQEAGFLRYQRLVEQGRLKESYNWELALDLHTARRSAAQLVSSMSKEDFDKASEEAVQSDAESEQELGDPDGPHFEWDDETTELGLGLIDQERQENEAEKRKGKPRLVIPNGSGEWDEV